MARESFRQELDQIHLQVELVAARVDAALQRMHEVLRTGDLSVAGEAIAADDQIDAMVVSLTERVYDLMAREAPVASDLRYLVSVVRVLEGLERIGDLALRVVKQTSGKALASQDAELFATLDEMALVAREVYRLALDAWAAEEPTSAGVLAERSSSVDAAYGRLIDRVLRLQGPGAVPLAVAAVLVGRALERIADHTVIVGERLQYLLTGDPAHLASEVR